MKDEHVDGHSDRNVETIDLLADVRKELEHDDLRALSRAKLGIGLRLVLIAFVIGYMTWVSSAVSKLDAPALTRVAVAHFEDRVPELRAEIRDYAIARAPEVTDRAGDLLVQLPARLREALEGQLLAKTDELISRLETDVDLALTVVVDDQIELVRAELPDGTPEQQLDAMILGVSNVFRDTMIAAVDEMYIEYSGEIRRLNAYLEHLQRSDDLTESEELDKELIETWMVLVHKYEITDPMKVATELQARF
jgi:hypothetical protein